MRSLEVWKALERTDSDVAGFLAGCMVADELADAYDEVLSSQGEAIVKMLRKREGEFRRQAGGTFVSSVAKSGESSDRAYRLAAAADEAAVLADEISKASFGAVEQWLLGGRTVNRQVARDAKGRFASSVSSSATSDPESGQWRMEGDQAPNRGGGRNLIPASLQASQFKANDQGGVEYQESIDPGQREETERYLGQVEAVQDLVGELARMFPDKKKDIEMNLTMYDPSTSDLITQPIPVTDNQAELNAELPEDVNREFQQLTYGPRAGMDPYAAGDMRAKMLAQSGVFASEPAPDQLNAIAQAMMPTQDERFQSGPKRLKRALQSWGAVMQTLPDGRAKKLGDMLVGAADGGLMDAAENLRPAMLKQSFRFRGTRKEEIDPEIVAQVQGEMLSPQEQVAFDVETGQASPDAAMAAYDNVPAPTSGENAAGAKLLKDQADAQKYLDRLKYDLDALPPGPSPEREQLGYEIDSAEVALKNANKAARQGVRATTPSQNKAKNTKDKLAAALGAEPSTNYAFNALYHRKNVMGQSGLDAAMGAQRDAGAFLLLKKIMANVADVRGADFGARDSVDGTITAQDTDRLSRQIAVNLGQGFPSEGIMIDRHGKVTQQSIGAGEDFYLPFDMSAYKRLAGGSYVRTRQLGGPTSEDLMALIAGSGVAGTVVSRSGVFTVQFDQKYMSPAKVGRMTRMYERILNDIAKGGMYLNQMDPEERAEEKARVEARPNLKGMEAGERKKYVNEEMDRWDWEQRNQQIKDQLGGEMVEQRAFNMFTNSVNLGTQATTGDLQAHWNKMDDLGKKKFYSDARKSVREELERKLLVNGEGYEVALRTLQRYFPYAIKRVERQELPDFVAHVQGLPSDRGSIEQSASQFVQTRQEDTFRVKPGDVYSGGEEALNPKLGQEGSGWAVPTGASVSVAPTNTDAPERPDSEGSEGGATDTPSGDLAQVAESQPEVDGDEGMRAARVNVAVDGARGLTNNLRSGLQMNDALLDIALLPDAVQARMASDDPKEAQKRQKLLLDTLFGEASANGKRLGALLYLTGREPLDDKNLGGVLRRIAGTDGDVATRSRVVGDLLDVQQNMALGQEVDAADVGNFADAATTRVAEMLAKLDWSLQPPQKFSGKDFHNDYDGRALFLDGFTDAAGDYKKAARTLASDYENSKVTFQKPLEDRIEASSLPGDSIEEVIKGLVDLKDGDGSFDFIKGDERQLMSRTFADTLMPALKGERMPDTKYAQVLRQYAGQAGVDLSGGGGGEELALLADTLIADYSTVARINALLRADNPKAWAGSGPATKGQTAKPLDPKKLPPGLHDPRNLPGKVKKSHDGIRHAIELLEGLKTH